MSEDDCNLLFTEGFLAGCMVSTVYFIICYSCRKETSEEINPPPYEQV